MTAMTRLVIAAIAVAGLGLGGVVADTTHSAWTYDVTFGGQLESAVPDDTDESVDEGDEVQPDEQLPGPGDVPELPGEEGAESGEVDAAPEAPDAEAEEPAVPTPEDDVADGDEPEEGTTDESADADAGDADGTEPELPATPAPEEGVEEGETDAGLPEAPAPDAGLPEAPAPDEDHAEGDDAPAETEPEDGVIEEEHSAENESDELDAEDEEHNPLVVLD